MPIKMPILEDNKNTAIVRSQPWTESTPILTYVGVGSELKSSATFDDFCTENHMTRRGHVCAHSNADFNTSHDFLRHVCQTQHTQTGWPKKVSHYQVSSLNQIKNGL